MDEATMMAGQLAHLVFFYSVLGRKLKVNFQHFSCGGTNRGYGRGTGAANTGGGFWTGMGVGGLMGYMFGNRG